MTKDTVVAFRAPDGFSADPLTDLRRQGARHLIAQAVKAELNRLRAIWANVVPMRRTAIASALRPPHGVPHGAPGASDRPTSG